MIKKSNHFLCGGVTFDSLRMAIISPIHGPTKEEKVAFGGLIEALI